MVLPVISKGTPTRRCIPANGRRQQKYTEGYVVIWKALPSARLAQSVERKALNLVVVGSSPTVGDAYCRTCVHGAAKAELDHICGESNGEAPPLA